MAPIKWRQPRRPWMALPRRNKTFEVASRVAVHTGAQSAHPESASMVDVHGEGPHALAVRGDGVMDQGIAVFVVHTILAAAHPQVAVLVFCNGEEVGDVRITLGLYACAGGILHAIPGRGLRWYGETLAGIAEPEMTIVILDHGTDAEAAAAKAAGKATRNARLKLASEAKLFFIFLKTAPPVNLIYFNYKYLTFKYKRIIFTLLGNIFTYLFSSLD